MFTQEWSCVFQMRVDLWGKYLESSKRFKLIGVG